MTSCEAKLVPLLPNLKMLLSVEIILEAATQIKFSKPSNFQEKYLPWSSVIVKQLSLRFTVILLMILKHYFVELCYGSMPVFFL